MFKSTKITINLIRALALTGVSAFLFIASLTQAQTANEKPTIHLVVGLVWEGDSVRSFNIAAIEKFRKQFPGIAMIHFLNPAYYTKPRVDAKRLNAHMQAVIGPQDSIGMHLHPWKSFVQSAGLVFRYSPTFWGNTLTSKACQYDCGHEVPLTAYREDELFRLVKHGKQILEKQGFPSPTSFSAGGWMASTALFNALSVNGINFDFSSAAPSVLKRRMQTYPLYEWLAHQWKNVSPTSQPYMIKTPTGPILEMGSTAAMADYVSKQELIDLFQGTITRYKANPSVSQTIFIGIYQESALTHINVIASALTEFFAMSQQAGIELKPMTLPDQTRKIAQQLSSEFLAH